MGFSHKRENTGCRLETWTELVLYSTVVLQFGVSVMADVLRVSRDAGGNAAGVGKSARFSKDHPNQPISDQKVDCVRTPNISNQKVDCVYRT